MPAADARVRPAPWTDGDRDPLRMLSAHRTVGRRLERVPFGLQLTLLVVHEGAGISRETAAAGWRDSEKKPLTY